MVANAPLIICVVLLIFVIAIFFVLIWMNSIHPVNKHEDPFKQYIKIENDSYSDKMIEVEDKKFLLTPGESKSVTVMSDSKIKASEFSMRLENSSLVNKVYITENGIFSNLRCGPGILYNVSEVPVMFIEIGSDSKKWNKGIVYPGKTTDAIISYGSKWEVISPDRKMLLGHVKARGGLKIIYNGKHLVNK